MVGDISFAKLFLKHVILEENGENHEDEKQGSFQKGNSKVFLAVVKPTARITNVPFK